MRFIIRFYWILEHKEYLAKINNQRNHYGAEPNAAASA